MFFLVLRTFRIYTFINCPTYTTVFAKIMESHIISLVLIDLMTASLCLSTTFSKDHPPPPSWVNHRSHLFSSEFGVSLLSLFKIPDVSEEA